MGCANRRAGKTYKVQGAKLNWACLCPYLHRRGRKEVPHTCEESRTGPLCKSHGVTWRLKPPDPAPARVVAEQPWAARTVWSAGCHHARETETKHAEVQTVLRLRCKSLPWHRGAFLPPSTTKSRCKFWSYIWYTHFNWIGISQSFAGHHVMVR